MSAEFSSKREEGSLASGPSFRSNQRKILNLLLERDASFSISSDLPTTPVEKKLFGDSANLSILSGGTPKRRLDLSNLSSGEMSATQLTASADFDETGHLESTGPEQVQLAGMNYRQHLIKCSPAQLFCSTPNALDHGRRKKDTICGSSANKENVAHWVKNLSGMQEMWFQSLVEKIPWRRAWQPTPVFLPGESHGQRSLAGYSPWGSQESGTTEATEHACTPLCQF